MTDADIPRVQGLGIEGRAVADPQVYNLRSGTMLSGWSDLKS
jgi:hypothetical protein